MPNTMKFGALYQDITPRDWIAGGYTPLKSNCVNPGGKWGDYLPVVEYQNRAGFDRMACGAYALLNCIEIKEYYITGIENNYSDRYLAKVSGTTKEGNYATKILDAIKEYGLVREFDWPDVDTNWNDYYKKIPQDVINKGKEWLQDKSVYREFVFKDMLIETLCETPVMVLLKYAEGNEILNPIGRYNHFVCLYGYEQSKYWEIYDHYTQTRKKYAWDYDFGLILKPIIYKNMEIFKPKDNKLYLLVEGKEQKLAMGLNGNLIIYDDKIDTLLNATARAKKYQIPTPITMDMWKQVDKLDGKLNIIETKIWTNQNLK